MPNKTKLAKAMFDNSVKSLQVKSSFSIEKTLAYREYGNSKVNTISRNLEGLFTGLSYYRNKSPKEIQKVFTEIYNENQDLAIRFLLYSRDIRGGAGERKFFREAFLLFQDHPYLEFLIDKVVELGRFDDLLLDWNSPLAIRHITNRFKKAYNDPNESGLAAKWSPRKGIWANRLSRSLGLSLKDYRKYIVSKTNVVETQMCSNQWNSIDYSKIPSKAHNIYRKSYIAHTPSRYESYINSLANKSPNVSLKADVLSPYELLKKANTCISSPLEEKAINETFRAIPYDLGVSILPIVDVSPSMSALSYRPIGSKEGYTCKELAMSLGLWVSYNQGAMKGLVLTFSENPLIIDYSQKTFTEAIRDLSNQNWGMRTNLTSSFQLIADLAKKNRLKDKDLPDAFLILTDMEMNTCVDNHLNYLDQLKNILTSRGFKKLPSLVFWNIKASGSKNQEIKVVNLDSLGAISLSGFSPKILKAFSDIIKSPESFTFESSLLEVLLNPRYDYLVFPL